MLTTSRSSKDSSIARARERLPPRLPARAIPILRRIEASVYWSKLELTPLTIHTLWLNNRRRDNRIECALHKASRHSRRHCTSARPSTRFISRFASSIRRVTAGTTRSISPERFIGEFAAAMADIDVTDEPLLFRPREASRCATLN
jgi:hypothetical protein